MRPPHVQVRRPDVLVEDRREGLLAVGHRADQMAPVELGDGLAVAGVLEVAARLGVDHPHVAVRAELDPQARHLRERERDRGAGVREHEALDAVGVVERVLERQAAAPGLAEQHHPLEPERVADAVELGHEAVDPPERRVVGLVGAAAAELVVEQHGQLVAGELLQPPQVLERDPRAAVQHDERDRAVAVALDVQLMPPVDRDASRLHRYPSARAIAATRRSRSARERSRCCSSEAREPRPGGSAPSSPRSEASSAHSSGESVRWLRPAHESSSCWSRRPGARGA